VRLATLQDLAFLAEMDLQADREDGEPLPSGTSPERLAELVTGHLAWVVPGDGLILGHVWRRGEGTSRYLPELAALLPAEALYAEVFQLWVRPEVRRQGLGRALKRKLEQGARQRGAVLVYTHTRARNEHVLALNRALGYHELRRGPLWDEVERVSLVKKLARSASAS
jgi:ribosomal protein S18 acetylase RimI-like enzyme